MLSNISSNHLSAEVVSLTSLCQALKALSVYDNCKKTRLYVNETVSIYFVSSSMKHRHHSELV